DYVIDRVSEDVPVVVGGGARQTPHELRDLEGRSPVVLAFGPEQLYKLGLGLWYGEDRAGGPLAGGQALRGAPGKGDDPAAGDDAMMLYAAQGTNTDLDEADRLMKAAVPALTKAAEDGDHRAAFVLTGSWTWTTSRTERVKVIHWLKKAAEAGNTKAMLA